MPNAAWVHMAWGLVLAVSAAAQERGRFPVAVLTAPSPDGVKVESGLSQRVKVAARSRVLLFSGERILGAVEPARDLALLVTDPEHKLIQFDPIQGAEGRVVRFFLPADSKQAVAVCRALMEGVDKVRSTLSVQGGRSRGGSLLSADSDEPLLQDRGWPQGEALLLPGRSLVLSWPWAIRRLRFFVQEGGAWKPLEPLQSVEGHGFVFHVAVDALPMKEGQVLAWLPDGAPAADIGRYRLRLATPAERNQVGAFITDLGVEANTPPAAQAAAYHLCTQVHARLNLSWLALQIAGEAKDEDGATRVLVQKLLQSDPAP